MVQPIQNQTDEQTAREFAYSLVVKASTLTVYVDSTDSEMNQDGSLTVWFLSADRIESEQLIDFLSSYPCLEGFNLPHATSKLSPKAERKLNLFFQRRGCHLHEFIFFEIFMQIDIFCSLEENAAIDEAEYVKYNLKKTYESNFQISNVRLVAVRIQYERDLTNIHKMSPLGFQRVAFDVSMLIGVAKD